MTQNTKTCNRCGTRQLLTNFDRHPMARDRHINQCKICRCIQRNAHYAKCKAAMLAEAVG
jgi:hypothetical protein